jgi:hypothetical protein
VPTIPILRDEIIITQKNNMGTATSKDGCNKVTGRSLVSVRMWKEPYGSKKDWLCQGRKF